MVVCGIAGLLIWAVGVVEGAVVVVVTVVMGVPVVMGIIVVVERCRARVAAKEEGES
jgi:hypothetical protein